MSEDERVRYSLRAPCRQCGRRYMLPVGQAAMPSGIGPCCQLTLIGDHWSQDMVGSLNPADIVDGGVQVELELAFQPYDPASADRPLCEACRTRLSDGQLFPPGTELCTGCADEAVEHWLAWLIDPTHSWVPEDDPYGAARHSIAGWHLSDPVRP